ncbi:hypothetical protein AAL_05506 [Moelleriella libera RCEF 2490]|uniref:Uncharacterized protein n=1 Tax=Moelleriella libera RCEF 2490 TaxID=1081109 RepID=A0A166P136_9HYPO|nr:hypothetical protein AAL_05506 [Moelleriella libera RCEF 2490]
MSSSSGFLSLAPATSASYPQAPIKRPEAGRQRSSSTSSSSSSGSSSSGHRILKLGPVHWGEHQGEHQGDFHEATSVTAA